jgi:hypothetical protein
MHSQKGGSSLLAAHLFERTERTTLAKLEREEKRKALNDLQEKKLAKREMQYQ